VICYWLRKKRAPISDVAINKRDLSERDICSKFIGPAVKRAGWDGIMQIREEVAFTKGRIIVRGKLVTRGKPKRADYILYYKPNIPIAVIEAKDNNHSVGDGMQQALDYAVTLNIPFVFSSNGDGFVFHDRTGLSAEKESSVPTENSISVKKVKQSSCGKRIPRLPGRRWLLLPPKRQCVSFSA
jgi:type I restriction enzyme, R subunit